MTDPNKYIVEKDAEWVQRWEAREVDFRKTVELARAEYDRRLKVNENYVKKIDKTLHDQQRVILKIRSIPFVGQRLIEWAGYES